MSFFERISFYKSKLIIGQIKKGETYEKVKKTICIVITDFNLIENSAPDRYHHLYRLHDPADGTYFGDVEEVHLFELPRLPKTPDGSALWDWIAFIKAREEKDLEMVEKRNPEVKQAVKALYRMSADENLRYKYEVREKAWRDEQARLLYSRQEGLAKGIEKGIVEGLERGIVEGLERGRQEGIERFILAARRMKACGMGAADIALCTGLSPEQIADL